jgi:predicted amidohydrolase
MSTVCAYSDVSRRERHDEDYARPAWVEERVRAAASAGCEFVVFPELTVATTADAVSEPLSSSPPAVVLGARIAERFEAGRAVLGAASSNSICSANVAPDRMTCTARVDKQFLIPFVEANLFRTIPGLSAVGARVTALIMGAENPTNAATTATVLEVKPGLSVGVLNCAELFRPFAIQRDANGTRVDPQLLVAVADHSGFPPLRTLRVLTRHLARLQTVAAGTPLLLVSTEDAAFFSADGEERQPRIRRGDFYLWVL